MEGCPRVHPSIFLLKGPCRQECRLGCRIWLHLDVWLSVKMSMAVSRSMSQSSNLEESCPSNMGISWSKDVVSLNPSVWHAKCLCMLAWLCAQVLHYAGELDVVGASVGCYNLYVSCVNSAVCVDGWVADFK